jgi:hypothetical protein
MLFSTSNKLIVTLLITLQPRALDCNQVLHRLSITHLGGGNESFLCENQLQPRAHDPVTGQRLTFTDKEVFSLLFAKTRPQALTANPIDCIMDSLCFQTLATQSRAKGAITNFRGAALADSESCEVFSD